MSKRETLVNKLIRQSSSFTYEEAKSLMGKMGYIEKNKGKTSGSRVAFYNPETGWFFNLHKPHPEKELPNYAIEGLIEFLKDEAKIK